MANPNPLPVVSAGSAEPSPAESPAAPAIRRPRTTRPLIADNPHIGNQIVDRGLCVRCGACEPACPVDIIRFDKQTFFPYITDEEKCIKSCTRCIKVCPGEEVDFGYYDERMFGVKPDPRSVTGIVNRAMVSCATDEQVRYKGSSGGFVTQFLRYLLDTGVIDGALVLGTENTDGKGWAEKPYIARTVEQLKVACKSKYRVIPYLQPIAEMEKIEGNYAVVALPCHMHALRKYQRVSPKLRERLKLIIGLYCNIAFEPRILEELCESHGVKPKDVADVQFRYGDWPGGVYAELQDGTRQKLLTLEEMKDEFNMLKGFYTPSRCNMCMDFSVEWADLAAGDPWLRGPDGKYLFTDGWTSVITRTKLADRLMDQAQEAGYIKNVPVEVETFMENFEKAARYKRDFVPIYIQARKMLGLPVPEYHRPMPHGIKPLARLRLWIKVAFTSMSMNYKWFRKLGLKLAQTKPALAYYRWNRKRKAERFAEGYAKQHAFVQAIKPPASLATGETSGFETR